MYLWPSVNDCCTAREHGSCGWVFRIKSSTTKLVRDKWNSCKQKNGQKGRNKSCSEQKAQNSWYH